MGLTLSDWAGIAEIAGMLGVIVSLIFLIRQISDNTRSVRVAAAHDASTAMQLWYVETGTNQQACKVIYRGFRDPSALSAEERHQFVILFHGVLLALQNGYFLGQEGALDRSLHVAISETVLSVKDMPGFKYYWGQRKSMFIGEFRKFVDGLETRDAGPVAAIYHEKN